MRHGNKVLEFQLSLRGIVITATRAYARLFKFRIVLGERIQRETEAVVGPP